MGANPVVSFKYKTTSYDWDETTASANAVKYILEVTKDDGATWTTVIPEAANVSSADFVKATVGLPASYANQIAMARITFRLVAGDIMVRLDDVDMGSGYRVTFDANGGAATTASDMTGTDSKLSSLPTPTRTGYTFNGWFTEKTGGTQVSTNTVFSADATIYARWTPITYTITYILAGGAVEPANPTNYTAETTTFTLNNPTRTDYTFAGWTGANGATPQATVSVAQGSAGDKSYTANWSTVSVLSPDRVIPRVKPAEEKDVVVMAPITVSAGEFTVGPNPVAKQSGVVSFFRLGSRVESATLSVYDASGNVVNRVKISDKASGNQSRRTVGSWDLRDTKGRAVSDGTYLVKGVIKTVDGNSEKVSLIVGVR